MSVRRSSTILDLAILTAASLLAVAAISCSSGLKGLKAEDRVFTGSDFWRTADSLYSDYGGGWWLRDKTTSINYEGGNWYLREQYHYQLVVLDAGKMESFADFTIPFGPSSRLTRVEARTIKSSGEVQVVDPKNMYEKSRIPGFMLYSDTKEKVFAMPGFCDSCIIDVAFSREDEALYLMDEFDFGSVLPVRRARFAYSIDGKIHSAGFRVFYKTYNVSSKPKDTIFDTALGKMVQWTWELHDLDAYPNEPWMPPRETLVPRIALAGFAPGQQPDDWGHFISWYADVLPSFDRPEPEIARLAGEIAGGAATDREKVQRVIDYVGGNLRYVCVSLRDSGYRPNQPKEVMVNKYGDCKDMSCLVVGLLRAAGVTAYPALVLTTDEGVMDRSLVLPRFNHMIVYANADGADLWLDPTAAPFPIGYLPGPDRGADILAIKDEEALWMRTPEDSPFKAARWSSIDIILDSSGQIKGTCRLGFEGELAFDLTRRYASLSKSEVDKAISREMGSFLDGAGVDSCDLIVASEDPPAVCISSGFTKPSAAVRVDDKIVLKPAVINPMCWGLADLAPGERVFPLWFPSGWEEADTIRVRIPDGWEVDRMPGGGRSEGQFGSYLVASTRTDYGLAVVVQHSLDCRTVAGKMLPEFRKFWAESRDKASQEVVLRRI